MVILSGTLFCRNADYRELQCELGWFIVDDPRLHDLPTDEQQGFFEIEHIEKQIEVQQGKYEIKIVATIKQFFIKPSVSNEKIHTFANEVQLSISNKTEINACPSNLSTSNDTDNDQLDQQLFGDLWPLGECVKLDPDRDRSLFDKQRLRLKVLGYKFKHDNQSWYLVN